MSDLILTIIGLSITLCYSLELGFDLFSKRCNSMKMAEMKIWITSMILASVTFYLMLINIEGEFMQTVLAYV